MHVCVRIEKTYTLLQELVAMKSENHDNFHNEFLHTVFCVIFIARNNLKYCINLVPVLM